MAKKTIKDLFATSIKLSSPRSRFPGVFGPCWIWNGKLENGYGLASLDGKLFRAHRLSYILEHGSIAAGYHICHKCDVRACCNPEHLFAGTAEQNNADLWKWHFVKDGVFIPGDYDEWRNKTLFEASWVKPALRELDEWEREAEQRVYVRNPILAEKFFKASFIEKIELIKKSYWFLDDEVAHTAGSLKKMIQMGVRFGEPL